MSNIKIALIGNMNNNFFTIARYLRDRGYDAHLFLLDESKHFLPINDTFDDSYEEWTHQLGWSKGDFFKNPPAETLTLLKEYDIIFACNIAMAYLDFAGRKIDIFMPHGSDMYQLPNMRVRRKYKMFIFNILRYITLGSGQIQYHIVRILDSCAAFIKSKYLSYLVNGIKFDFIAYHQKHGIVNASYSFVDTHILFPILMQLSPKGKVVSNITMPYVYLPHLEKDNLIKHRYDNAYTEEFYNLRANNELIVFHHNRLVWQTEDNPMAMKGNDKFVQGFANFVRRNPLIAACMINFEYGVDVEPTKKLIAHLGIESHVKWFPMMPRKDVMIGLSLSDIGCGQMINVYLGGGTLIETIAMGKPLLGYRDDGLFREQYDELYPMINVMTSEDVTLALEDYLLRPDYYVEMGMQAKEWFKKYCVDQAINYYSNIIDEIGPK